MRIRQLPKTEWKIELYTEKYYEHGKVDILLNEEGKIGERVYCLFWKKDIKKYNDDNCFDETLAILCNNCGVSSNLKFLSGLRAGQIVPVKFNGKYYPSIPLNWLRKKFWKE